VWPKVQLNQIGTPFLRRRRRRSSRGGEAETEENKLNENKL